MAGGLGVVVLSQNRALWHAPLCSAHVGHFTSRIWAQCDESPRLARCCWPLGAVVASNKPTFPCWG